MAIERVCWCYLPSRPARPLSPRHGIDPFIKRTIIAIVRIHVQSIDAAAVEHAVSAGLEEVAGGREEAVTAAEPVSHRSRGGGLAGGCDGGLITACDRGS